MEGMEGMEGRKEVFIFRRSERCSTGPGGRDDVEEKTNCFLLKLNCLSKVSLLGR